MSITNVSKPSSSYTNSYKVNTGEIWDVDTLAWQNESQTWLDTATTIDNSTRISSSIINTTKVT